MKEIRINAGSLLPREFHDRMKRLLDRQNIGLGFGIELVIEVFDEISEKEEKKLIKKIKRAIEDFECLDSLGRPKIPYYLVKKGIKSITYEFR